MNVETIQLPRAQARAKIEAWRHRLDRNPDPKARLEYEAALAGYRALARGTPVLDLGEVFRAVPVDAKGRPALAIARADARTVQLDTSTGRFIFGSDGNLYPRSNAAWGTRFEIHSPQAQNRPLYYTAIVPMIPPEVGPKRIDLRRHAILWEAAWESVPVDPMLLRPLAGNLYAVIAAWDLTPLERAVIAGRLR